MVYADSHNAALVLEIQLPEMWRNTSFRQVFFTPLFKTALVDEAWNMTQACRKVSEKADKQKGIMSLYT